MSAVDVPNYEVRKIIITGFEDGSSLIDRLQTRCCDDVDAISI